MAVPVRPKRDCPAQRCPCPGSGSSDGLEQKWKDLAGVLWEIAVANEVAVQEVVDSPHHKNKEEEEHGKNQK